MMVLTEASAALVDPFFFSQYGEMGVPEIL